ncbi:MAG: gfo/Idh/MocA family oxidoreductase [Planctomycetaceae bacterium]|nr:MAG: gfo/Idh/MocA family oxidoreductase [Planctomycetaceae bacterium]
MTLPQTVESANRRDFLKHSTLAAVGATVLSQVGIAHGAYAGGDDLIKVGLVGCGGRGSGAAAQALSTAGNVKLVAMGDAFADRIKSSINAIQSEGGDKVVSRMDVPPERQFTGFDAYQKVIDSGIDLVILTTPPGFRPLHFEAAVKAGKHVFMEKPVAVDAPGVRQVLAAAAEAKKKNLGVGVGLQRHHQESYLETIKRLQDGAIGDIHTTRAYWNDRGVWVIERQPGMSEMTYQMRNWYYFNWLCGDHICEQHIHNLDVINWLKNGYPVRAWGMGGRQVRTDKKYGEIFDHHAVEFEYSDGSRLFSQCRHIEGCWSSVSEHAQGSKGSADISAGLIKVNGQPEWRYQLPKGTRARNPYQTEHDDLFASIRAGKPLNEAENGAYSTMTSILGRMATYSGKQIEWKDALASEISLQPKVYDFEHNPPSMPNSEGWYAIATPGSTRVV